MKEQNAYHNLIIDKFPKVLERIGAHWLRCILLMQCLTYFHLLLTGCNYWQVAGQKEVLEHDVKYDMTCQEVIIILEIVGRYNSNIMVPPFLGEVIPRKLCHMLQKKLMWTLQNSLEAKRSCYKSLTIWNSCVIMIMC